MIIENLRACVLNELRIVALGALLVGNQQGVSWISIRLTITHLFSDLQALSEYLGGRLANIRVSFNRLTLLLLCIWRQIRLLSLRVVTDVVLIGYCLGQAHGLRLLYLLVQLD